MYVTKLAQQFFYLLVSIACFGIVQNYYFRGTGSLHPLCLRLIILNLCIWLRHIYLYWSVSWRHRFLHQDNRQTHFCLCFRVCFHYFYAESDSVQCLRLKFFTSSKPIFVCVCDNLCLYVGISCTEGTFAVDTKLHLEHCWCCWPRGHCHCLPWTRKGEKCHFNAHLFSLLLLLFVCFVFWEEVVCFYSVVGILFTVLVIMNGESDCCGWRGIEPV